MSDWYVYSHSYPGELDCILDDAQLLRARLTGCVIADDTGRFVLTAYGQSILDSEDS